MLVLIALRMPVGLAMLVTGSAGYAYIAGVPTFLNYMKSTPYFLFANYTLSVIPLFILIVLGGIYAGIFTPTEAAAVGMVAMLTVGLLQKQMSFADFKQSLVQTAETSAMIFAILLGAEVFDAFLGLSRMPEKAAEFVSSIGLPPFGVVALLLVFYILLGAVMDELAMILLTLPVFFPVVARLELGLAPDEIGIWFGILVLTVVGIGLTAPPIGLNVFVVSAIARDVPIAATYRGVLPFVCADIVRLGILTMFPWLSLVLVRWLN